MRLLEDLAAVPAGSRLALVLRHGERPPVLKPSDFVDNSLTPAGHQQSRELGRHLAERGFSVAAYHSPVRRCEETARALTQGVTEGGRRARLGGAVAELGAGYVRDPLWALPQALSQGKAFIRRWLDGQLPAERMASRRETAQLQLSGLVRAWTPVEPDTLAVFVTHDWNLLALREEVLGLRFEESGWIRYLDGAVLSARDGAVSLHHAGTSGIVPPDLMG